MMPIVSSLMHRDSEKRRWPLLLAYHRVLQRIPRWPFPSCAIVHRLEVNGDVALLGLRVISITFLGLRLELGKS